MQVLGTQFRNDRHHGTYTSFVARVGHVRLAAEVLGSLLQSHSSPCLLLALPT